LRFCFNQTNKVINKQWNEQRAWWQPSASRSAQASLVVHVPPRGATARRGQMAASQSDVPAPQEQPSLAGLRSGRWSYYQADQIRPLARLFEVAPGRMGLR